MSTCLLSGAWTVAAHMSIIKASGKPVVMVFLVFINQTGYGLEVREITSVLNAQPYHQEPYFHFSGLAIYRP